MKENPESKYSTFLTKPTDLLHQDQLIKEKEAVGKYVTKFYFILTLKMF